MRKFRIISILAGIVFCILGITAFLFQPITSDQRMTTTALISSDLMILWSEIVDFAQKRNQGLIPAFDSRTNFGHVLAYVKQAHPQRELSLKRALSRPWSYNIPPTVVNKRYEKLPDNTLLVRVNGVSRYAGIQVDRMLVRRS